MRQKLNREIDAEIGEEARKKLEEDARKNLDSGIGKEEILRQNVKKGGKYIVFIPVSDQGDIEDENGNRIGTKTGEDKIKAYQDYLNKMFEGTEIVPQLHSLLGSYSKDKNKEEIDSFESDNSEKTKFMVVMNKANEGLHIDGVDGIIWFRALDENSRILYLQQLGRAIYALDEDNPLPDDKRPIVIDLANNSLTVKIEKEFENVKSIDDLEALTIVIEWIEQHDGMLPDRNSSNKQEQHYYAVLRRIQSKYSKYLDGFDNFEDLKEEDKSRIQEIIDLATEIDLWNMDLPPIPKTKGSKDELDPFTIEGVLRDFVEFENEIDGIEKERAISKFVKVCEALSRQGFDFENIKYTKQIEIGDGEKQTIYKTLADIQKEYPQIDIERIMEEIGVDLDYQFARIRTRACQAIKGNIDDTPISDYEEKKLIELGVIKLEKESSISRFVKVCKSLAKQGFDFENATYTKQIKKKGKKNTIHKTLKDIKQEYPDIDIEKVIEEAEVDLDYPIGSAHSQASSTLRGYGTTPVTNEERQELISLGVIKVKRESSMSKFVRVCELLAKQGFDFSSYDFSKTIEKDGKKIKTKKTLEDIKQEYPDIDIEKVIEEAKVNLDYPIGNKRNTAVGACKNKGETPITEEQKKKLINLGVVQLEKESSMSEFVRVCESLQRQGFDFYKYKYTNRLIIDGKKITLCKTLKDIREECPDIDIDKVIMETGVDIDYSIGMKRKLARNAANGKGTTTITEEEKQTLINIGILSIENRLEQIKQQREEAKNKNDQVREFEEQVAEQLKKRGKIHEEQ